VVKLLNDTWIYAGRRGNRKGVLMGFMKTDKNRYLRQFPTREK
jgi:hypothetical protein